MIAEEELIQVRQENRLLREQACLQQDKMSLRQELISRQQKQITLLERELGLQQQQLTQQVKALHELLATDSRNSHLPLSSDRFSRQPKSLRKKSGKKPGGQESHPGQTLLLSPCPDEVMVHAVERCEQCQQVTVAAFPAEDRAPVQYGPMIAAMAVYLVQQQRLPLAHACEVMEDLLAVSLSEGTLCDLIARCARNLADVEQHIKEALISSSVIHQDETGLDVEGHCLWMHVTCTPTLTHLPCMSAEGAALDATGIWPRFAGTSVHDGWRSYFLYACAHALCLVHLLHALTFLAEEQGLEWAADLKALLLTMKEAADEAREQGLATLHPLEVEDWKAQFLALVAHVDALTPTLRLRTAKKDAPNRVLHVTCLTA